VKNALLLLTALTLALSGMGCGEAGPQQLDENYVKNAEQVGKQRREIFLRASGDFDAMSPEDKKAFVSGFDSEPMARKYWDVMKNPPSSTLPPGAGQR
jgi:hypothetical protein